MNNCLQREVKSKVCIIASHLPQGGAERQIIELIKGLMIKNYHLTLILYQSDFIFYSELLELNIDIIANKKNCNKSNKIKRWIESWRFLKTHLNQKDYDILHTFLFHNGLLVRALAPKKYYGRIIYSIRNSYESVSWLYLYIDSVLNKRSINIFNSYKSFNFFKKKSVLTNHDNSLVIYNGYDTGKFHSSSKYKKTDVFTIGMVGRVTFQKNQIQLVRVLKDLKHIFDFELYIIGDDNSDEANEIKIFLSQNGLENNVFLLGGRNNIQDYYGMFDLFVLTSRYEGCPNVLFEALLSKCLCLVSENSNSDNFITDGINGFEYDNSDEMLKEKLLYCYNLLEDNSHKLIIEKGYEYAVENFALEEMIKSYENVYNQLIKSKIK